MKEVVKFVAVGIITLVIISGLILLISLGGTENENEDDFVQKEYLKNNESTAFTTFSLNKTMLEEEMKNNSVETLSLVPRSPFTTVKLETKLTLEMHSPGVLYDGSDSIYLFGGWKNAIGTGQTDGIFHFSISSQNLTRIGTLPSISSGGTLQWIFPHDGRKNNSILYFGGGAEGTPVYRFDTGSHNISRATMLDKNVRFATSFKMEENSDIVLIFGGLGQDKQLLAFGLEALKSAVIVESLQYTIHGSTSVRVGNRAFIYGGGISVATGKNVLYEMNLENFDMRPVGDPLHPRITETPSSIWDGKNGLIYFFGGYDSSTVSFGFDGLTRFDPVSLKSEFVTVKNFPVQQTDKKRWYAVAPSCVWVGKLERIYCFGGKSESYGANYEYHDDIFYIDL